MKTPDEEVRDYGLRVKPVQPDHFIAGSGQITARFGAAELNPKKDWTKFAKIKELQNRFGFETMNCSNYATGFAVIAAAQIQGFIDFVQNSSERFTGVMTKTDPSGNDPHDVIEIIRTLCGLIEEEKLPWTKEDTWNEYYAPNPMDETLVALGQSLLKRYVIGHEWVIKPGSKLTPKQKETAILNMLGRAPVCVSVRAWEKDGDVYVKDIGAPDTHWVMLIRYDKKEKKMTVKEDGKLVQKTVVQMFPIVRDQYSPYEKKLAPEYDFGFAKAYFVKKNETGATPMEEDYLTKFLKWAKSKIDAFFKTKKPEDTLPLPPDLTNTIKPLPPMATRTRKLYDLAKSLLSMHLGLDKSIPWGVNCANAATHVLIKAGVKGLPAKGIAGTAALLSWLQSSSEFDEVDNPEPGDIIMSATGTGNGKCRGHVGIVGQHQIMSNNSETGLWDTQWTMDRWNDYYRAYGGILTRYFRLRG